MPTNQPGQPNPQPNQPSQPDNPDPDQPIPPDQRDQDQYERQFPSATVGGEGDNTPEQERVGRRDDEKSRRQTQEERGAVEAQPDVETR